MASPAFAAQAWWLPASPGSSSLSWCPSVLMSPWSCLQSLESKGDPPRTPIRWFWGLYWCCRGWGVPVAAPPGSLPAAGYFCGHQEQQVATPCCIRLGRCHVPQPGQWVPHNVTVTSWTSPCSAPPCPAREWLQEGLGHGVGWVWLSQVPQRHHGMSTPRVWDAPSSAVSLSATMSQPPCVPRMLRAQLRPLVTPRHSHTTRPGCSVLSSVPQWHRGTSPPYL